jgi:hypothetical protein
MSAPYSSGYVGVATFAWSPDSRCLYFLKPLGDSAGVWQLPVTGGSARRVLRFDDEARQWHRFGFRMRDGRIYLTLGDLQSDVWVAEIEGKR